MNNDEIYKFIHPEEEQDPIDQAAIRNYRALAKKISDEVYDGPKGEESDSGDELAERLRQKLNGN